MGTWSFRLGVGHKAEDLALQKKKKKKYIYIVKKSKEVKTGCNLEEYFKEGYDLQQGDALSPLLSKLCFKICH
jgi:hypothetical protein